MSTSSLVHSVYLREVQIRSVIIVLVERCFVSFSSSLLLGAEEFDVLIRTFGELDLFAS